MKEPEKNAKIREEFSVEFGDVNGIKLIELPLMNKKEQQIKKQKKDKPL